MDWTDETIARLRALWADGHSTAEIGRRMGVSKNAVVGKAHRLNLPPRPSPIRRDGVSGARARNLQPRRVVGPTLPSLATTPPASAPAMATPTIATPTIATPTMAEQVAPTPEMTAQAPAAAQATIPTPIPAPNMTPVAAVVQAAAPAPAAPYKPVAVRAVAPRAPRLVACCWPLGEPGTKSFRFCDAEATHGKPYCHAHAQLAYVKVRDRREDAA
jgi:GcrA cell cycle regulator